MSHTTTHGTLSYLDRSVEPSLFRNGKVFTRRDPDGSDHDETGATPDPRRVTIGNARNLDADSRMRLGANGFELLHAPMAIAGFDFFDQESVVTRFYPQCAEIVRDAVGARAAFAFDHNIRWAPGKADGERISGGQQVQAPIHCVHGDYTLASAPARLRDLARPPGINDTLGSMLAPGQSLLDPEAVETIIGSGRFAIINLWRNIDDVPVQSDPLALCDGQTVTLEDLVVYEIHYSDRIGENYFARFNDRHAWWYYPAVTPDEAILIKQWDSAGTLARSGGQCADSAGTDGQRTCTFSFHSAFADENTPPHAPDRQSIEVRCVVLF